MHLTAPASNDETATRDDHLATDIVGFRTAEQIDGAGDFFRRAAAFERYHSGHGVEHGLELPVGHLLESEWPAALAKSRST